MWYITPTYINSGLNIACKKPNYVADLRILYLINTVVQTLFIRVYLQITYKNTDGSWKGVLLRDSPTTAVANMPKDIEWTNRHNSVSGAQWLTQTWCHYISLCHCQFLPPLLLISLPPTTPPDPSQEITETNQPFFYEKLAYLIWMGLLWTVQTFQEINNKIAGDWVQTQDQDDGFFAVGYLVNFSISDNT